MLYACSQKPRETETPKKPADLEPAVTMFLITTVG